MRATLGVRYDGRVVGGTPRNADDTGHPLRRVLRQMTHIVRRGQREGLRGCPVNLRLRSNGRIGAGCGREWVSGEIPRNANDTGDPLRRVPRQMTQIGQAGTTCFSTTDPRCRMDQAGRFRVERSQLAAESPPKPVWAMRAGLEWLRHRPDRWAHRVVQTGRNGQEGQPIAASRRRSRHQAST